MIRQFRNSLTARLHQNFHQYAEDRRGLAAVEFALIAAPFFFLLFGLLEICLLFVMSTVLDHAVAEATRPLRTGEAQKNELSEMQFRLAICDRMMGLLKCNERLHIDVRTIDSFANTPNNNPLNSVGEVNNEDFGFAPGGPNDVVAVRIFYEWDLIVPGITMPLSNMPGNRHLLNSTAVFRNEPFGS